MDKPQHSAWRRRVHEIVYESDTRAGRLFDIILVGAILLSVLIIMLESVKSIEVNWHMELKIVEWFFTIIFTTEYALRLISVTKPIRYATSFFGVVDLIAILPTWLSIFLPGAQFLLSIRVLRLLRIFRILKLAHYLSQAEILKQALAASQRKITVFLVTVTTIVIIVGSLIYVIEGEAHGFTSIPQSIYWAIVTLTTVGYGDISPKTPLGQTLASLVMIMGYGIIAVPTGIVTAELTQIRHKEVSGQSCPACSLQGHDPDAQYCKFCGEKL
ncbi:MAG TPA: ion transporter [Turneriella sp.]|nr:ion transporter [Turneriella sp.]HMY10179.1 ion transporter [Turneriella sp.]